MKEFLKTVKGKICVIAAGVVLLAGAVWGGYGLWYYQQPKFHDVTIELGTSAVTLDMFLTEYGKAEKCRFVTDLSKASLETAGQQDVTLAQGGKEETVRLTIKDTVAPEVVFKDFITDENRVPNPADFIEKATDLSEMTYSFSEELGVIEDYSVLELTVVVTDASGNQTSGTCKYKHLWMHETLVVELGTPVTKADILVNPTKDEALIDQALLDTINATGVGEYTVESTSGNQTQSCVVTVQDTTPPALELCDVTRYIGVSCSMESFIASSSDPSGVICTLKSALDVSTEGTYTVTIEAVDAYGNAVEKQATLYVTQDTDGPYFSGVDTMYVSKHSSPDYMSGVSAYDELDGSCSVSYDASAVNTAKSGTYYVTYTSADTKGNASSYRRKVVVSHDSADTDALVVSMAQQCGSDPETIRDFVRDYIGYNTNWGGDDPVWYGFTNRIGNCYVHALCLQRLLEYHGYETQLIWVTNQTHYWLLINLNGTWRHIDATPSTLHGRYSLMTDAQRAETLSGREWDRSAWPACE